MTTVNCRTQVLVKMTNSTGGKHLSHNDITAELKHSSQATVPRASKWQWSKKSAQDCVAVAALRSASQYEVSYTAMSRGQHKLHININGMEINGSPFTVMVYPDPTQLGHPVRVITDLNGPYAIAFNSCGEMIVSERDGHRVSMCNTGGEKYKSFGSRGDSSDQMKSPKGVAIDDSNNMYVSSLHKLQKFTASGELVKHADKESVRKEGGFDDPCGLTIFNKQLYVCDQSNHCIYVYDLDLNYLRSIGTHGSGRGEFDTPLDVKIDSAGFMYVAEFGNKRVQVMDTHGQFVREFGQDGERKLCGPSGLYVADKHVYVSDFSGHCIVVYETSGRFVTSFGRFGWKEGQFRYPCCITCCVDGFVHVCDSFNGRVQIF